jgi:AbiV family abortive infection protein
MAANAGDLLEEARLLVGNGHSARAHALGTLAFEEMGKRAVVLP